jgi:hypothetical protein
LSDLEKRRKRGRSTFRSSLRESSLSSVVKAKVLKKHKQQNKSGKRV